MEILNVAFEDTATIEINGIKVGLTPFREQDENIVKIGINAPKCLTVNREEIQKQLIEARKNK